MRPYVGVHRWCSRALMPTRPYSRLPPHVSTQQRDSLLEGLPVLVYQDPYAPATPSPLNDRQDSRQEGGGADEDDVGVPLLPSGGGGHPVLQSPLPTSADPRSAPPEYKSPMSWQLANPDYGYSQYYARASNTLLPDAKVAGVGSGPSPLTTRPYSADYFQSKSYNYNPEPSSPPRRDLKTVSHKSRRRGLFGRAWEAPQWRPLAVHFSLCALTYPCLLFFIAVSRGKSLFWTRVFVGAGCGVMGFALDLSLMALAKGIMEACIWATVIHQSHLPESHGPGIRLKDLAAQSDDPASAWSALRLLWDRHAYRGADIENRKHYDKRRWNFWILVFLANVALAGSLSFILGRIVNIDVLVEHQKDEYNEIPVQATLSVDDLNRAQDVSPNFENFAFTWTLSPFASQGILPTPIMLQSNGSNVYFAEVLPDQLVPNGHGPGTFEQIQTLTKESKDQDATRGNALPSLTVNPGSVLRFPRWGIRIKCTKIPNPSTNIVPLSPGGFTYVYTPRSTLQGLFDDFSMSLPNELEAPVNLTQVLMVNDTAPAGLNVADTAMGAAFWNNGVAQSLYSRPVGNSGEDGNGFQTIETMLVRLNTTYAVNGTFGVLGNTSVPDKDGHATFVGYDAVICLELYEPWVLEVYNSSIGLPNSIRVIDKAATVRSDMSLVLRTEHRLGDAIDNPTIGRVLTSAGMYQAYIAAHQNSVNQMLKDNGRDSSYVPSPTLVSFTDGSGPYGYTNLTAEHYAASRALADAGNVLPYFVGSGQLVARQYVDRVVSTAYVNTMQLGVTLAVVFLIGLYSALFLPRLPLDAPHRGFDLYSWLSAFYADELQPTPDSHVILSKCMELDDIVKHTCELRFRYVTPEK